MNDIVYVCQDGIRVKTSNLVTRYPDRIRLSVFDTSLSLKIEDLVVCAILRRTECHLEEKGHIKTTYWSFCQLEERHGEPWCETRFFVLLHGGLQRHWSCLQGRPNKALVHHQNRRMGTLMRSGKRSAWTPTRGLSMEPPTLQSKQSFRKSTEKVTSQISGEPAKTA